MKLPRVFFYDRSTLIYKELAKLNAPVEEISFEKHPELHQAVDTFQIDTIVSPGNSYGQLDGGFDLAINKYYHFKLGIANPSEELRKWLKGGYNPVGNTVIAEFAHPRLAHLPTMEVPSPIPKETPLVFNCVWNLLSEIERYNEHVQTQSPTGKEISRVLLTGLGTGVGAVTPHSCASQIALALKLWQTPVDHVSMYNAIRSLPL